MHRGTHHIATPPLLCPCPNQVAEQLQDEWDEVEEVGAEEGRLGEDEVRVLLEAVCEAAEAITGRSVRPPGDDGGGGGDGPPPFRALRKLFKQRLGTKVCNKLVRNRGEALI
tara:strand:- start:83 stop:418 length:336 start_codon:yes stop_codon:yes gene_type:complete